MRPFGPETSDLPGSALRLSQSVLFEHARHGRTSSSHAHDLQAQSQLWATKFAATNMPASWPVTERAAVESLRTWKAKHSCANLALHTTIARTTVRNSADACDAESR